MAMTMTAVASELDRGGGLLEENIRLARIAHAEKLTAVHNIHEAAVLRLEVLRDQLAPLLAMNAAARRVVDLALVPGDPPRLWIDMTSYVTMAPNPSTYRLQRDSFCRHELLLESENRDEIIAAAMQHVACHLVEREKQLALIMGAERHPDEVVPGRTSPLLVWLSGLVIGIATMAALASWALK
jgi:hypothetical protein